MVEGGRSRRGHTWKKREKEREILVYTAAPTFISIQETINEKPEQK